VSSGGLLTHSAPAEAFLSYYSNAYEAVGANTVFVSYAATNNASVIDLTSTPWWSGRFVEFTADVADPFWSLAVTLSDSSIAVSGSGTSDEEARGARDRPTKSLARRFGLDLGSGVVSVGRTALALVPVIAVAYASASTAAPSLPPIGSTSASAVVAQLPALAYGTTEYGWNESDDEPRWLAIDELPYHGGGVMARRRSDA
jgi:hypothetical protein